MNRRDLLGTLGAITAAPIIASAESSNVRKPVGNFKFCLNTSTISGQKLGLKEMIDVAARAGYDHVELWIRDVKQYREQGNSLSALRKFMTDSRISVINTIGFAPWMVEDDNQRKEGFKQMEEEMNIMAELGCPRIAAPPAGVKAGNVDLFKAGQYYKELIDLGRKTGVMPQLEFWGASGTLYHLGQVLMVAAVANDRDARILPDIYHLFRGGSGFDGLKMLNGKLVEVFHVNDFVSEIKREDQKDKDRVYPGDGVAPMNQVLQDLAQAGGTKILSLELFNENYWKQDALQVAKTGIEKIRASVKAAGV